MNVLDRSTAELWSSWFRALDDPTRLTILHTLAHSSAPQSVGEIVDTVHVGQSTVSHHLKVLAAVGFVEVEREGTSSRWRVNARCIDALPSVAEVVMGRVPAPGCRP